MSDVALQDRLAGVVYVTPSPTDEPEQVDRQTSMADFSEMLGRNTYFPATFEDLSIDGHLLKQKPSNLFLPPKQWPVAECEAHVETGAAISARVTATRVAAGAYLGGRAGALVGAIAKKDRTKVYLNIVTPDDVILKEVRGLDEGKARKFANKLNNAAAANGANPMGQDAQILSAASSSSTPPPPPPAGVPAGWYPQGDVQRFWDGKVWTDHTAPLPPS